MNLTNDQLAVLETAIDHELTRYVIHCDNCHRLIKERAIGLGTDPRLPPPEGNGADDDLLPFMACFLVRLSIKVQSFMNEHGRKKPSQKKIDRHMAHALKEAVSETNDRFYGRLQ